MSIKCPKCQFYNTSDSKFCADCGTRLTPSESITDVTKTLETPAQKLIRGTIFANRYEILEKLGKGGMGEVYRAYDKEVKEDVALKLIRSEISSDKKTIERFNRELKLARKIIHKNVGRMYELMEYEGNRFITMEYVEGQNLKGFIRQSGQLAIGTALKFAKQVCNGLSEAHRLGVVHRDLKPSNIMIDQDGNARIMDFGLARLLNEEGITRRGTMIGTPHYMSPEQVEGDDIDQRTDIYSLGVIFYEMVTGRVPFEGETAFTIGMKHKGEMPRNPKEFNAQIPEELSRVVLKCMEKDKKKRYQNTEELLSKLKKMKSDTTEASVVPEWKNSIAVLPFKNMSADPEQEYFCEGIAEELINSLIQIADLRVVARTSAFSFKGKDVDIREIGKKLNVDKVLEGSVRKAGNRLRITAQLVNVADGYHLWSERYDREMEDIFAIQDEVTLALVETLKVKLLGREKAKLKKRHTDDQEAYNLYLKGRYFLNDRTSEGIIKRIEYFNQAIELDPAYALAYVGLADSYILLGEWEFSPPKEIYPKAKTAVLKALEIDDRLSEAHCALAMIKRDYDWDWVGAEKEFKKALELNTNYPTAHQWYAEYLTFMGKHDEAIEEIGIAQELDPLSLIITAAGGVVFFCAREYDQGIEQCKKVLDLDSSYYPAHLFLALNYMQKGIYEEAIIEINKAIGHGGRGNLKAYIACSYALAGERTEAQKVFKDLRRISRQEFVSQYFYAIYYFVIGENDQGFKHLDEAIEKHHYLMIFIKVDPFLDGIRNDPRYKALLKKMNFE